MTSATALVALSLLAAQGTEPAAPEAQRTVLVLDLAAPELSDVERRILTGTVVRSLARHPELKVVSSDDLRVLVTLEEEKQAMGCDDTSCLAEVAGALGASHVVFGNVGKLGESLVVELSLFDAVKAQAVGREAGRASTIEALADELPDVTERVVASMGLAPLAVVDDGGLSPLAWGGIGLLVAGGLGAVLSAAAIAGGELAVLDTSGAVGSDGKTAALWSSRAGIGGALLFGLVAAGGGAALGVGLAFAE